MTGASPTTSPHASPLHLLHDEQGQSPWLDDLTRGYLTHRGAGPLRQPSLMVKAPATTTGVAAIGQLVSDGRSMNVTLVFGLPRYAQVIEAYLPSRLPPANHQPTWPPPRGVASFFISRVDTAVDRRLDGIGSPEAMPPARSGGDRPGEAGLQLFTEAFSGPRGHRCPPAALGSNARSGPPPR